MDNNQTTQPNAQSQEGEVKGHVLSQDEITDWGNGVVLDEKGMFAEGGEEVRKDESAEEETQGEQPNDDEEQAEEVPKAPEPGPIVIVEDPGEFVPKDYSFEVVVYDEDKNAKTVKVSSVEQFDELMESDPDFGTVAKAAKAIRAATNLESSVERDRREWQARKEEYDKQVEDDSSRNQAIQDLASEINYLVAKGKIPKADPKYMSADWSKPNVSNQPGVREQLAILEYMNKENEIRAKAGLKPITSALDAFNAMELEERTKKSQDEAKQAGEARKRASARVAGTSPAPVSSVPKGVAVGRGGSLRDLGQTW